MRPNFAAVITGLAISLGAMSALAQGTAFTYQGRLASGSNAANGSFDLTFGLFSVASGSGQVGGTITLSAVGVTNGLFTVALDFGANFPGPNRWLEIAVRTNGGGTFTTLTPRQELTPTPYAIYSENAATANNFNGTLSNAQLANSTITVNAGTGLSGGGTVALGSSTTLNNAGVLSVTGNADITASTVGGAVTLGDTATSANTASAIVKRDASGNFSVGNIDFASGDFVVGPQPSMPAIISRAGAGTYSVLWSDNSGNVFLGEQAGTDNYGLGTLSGSGNTIMGYAADINLGSGNYNTALGGSALLQNYSGVNNIALGYGAGYNILTGSNNIDIFVDTVGNQGGNENNTIRIGTQGTQTRTFVAGVFGATSASGVPVYVNTSGQLGTLTSSARFKENIHGMDDASEALLGLRPVTFRYKSELDPQGIPQFGLVAEEVEQVDPDLVARDDKNQIYTVRYEAVNAMLLNEFLKQHRTVKDQAAEIGQLRARLDKLEQLLVK